MLFSQGPDVNGDNLNWLKCVRNTTRYVQLPSEYVKGRDINYYGNGHEQVFVEACWRDLLEAFGIVVPPRDPMKVAFGCCANFIVSRDQVRSRPLVAYEKALELVGSPRCHRGALDFDKLIAANGKSDQVLKEWQAEAMDPKRADADGNRHAGAGAFEHLNHVFLGGQPFLYPPERESYCAKFLPASQCPGSPCKE